MLTATTFPSPTAEISVFVGMPALTTLSERTSETGAGPATSMRYRVIARKRILRLTTFPITDPRPQHRNDRLGRFEAVRVVEPFRLVIFTVDNGSPDVAETPDREPESV